MSIYSIYFSPTQGTKNITNTLAQGIGIYQEIDLCEYTDPIPERVFSENDICLIGVPSYGGRVPRTAVERINGFKGNGASAILVVSCWAQAVWCGLIPTAQSWRWTPPAS